MARFQCEELEHLAYAENNLPPGSIMAGLIEPLITLSTNLLIAL